MAIDNPTFGGAQNEQTRSAFAKLDVVKFKQKSRIDTMSTLLSWSK